MICKCFLLVSKWLQITDETYILWQDLRSLWGVPWMWHNLSLFLFVYILRTVVTHNDSVSSHSRYHSDPSSPTKRSIPPVVYREVTPFCTLISGPSPLLCVGPLIDPLLLMSFSFVFHVFGTPPSHELVCSLCVLCVHHLTLFSYLTCSISTYFLMLDPYWSPV